MPKRCQDWRGVGFDRALFRRFGVGVASMCAGGVLIGGLGGCEVGSYLDPSVIGRWEHTPTTVPILSRIAAIEPETDMVLEIDEIRPDDLVPEPRQFRIGGGDVVVITVFDLPARGQQTPFQRRVSETGEVSLPGVGSVPAAGRTASEIEQAFSDLIRERDLIVGTPVVSVEILTAQEAQYTVLGAVQAPGPYQLTRPDLRLLDVVAAAGGIDVTADEILIIRQTPLSERFDAATGRSSGAGSDGGREPGGSRATGNELIDLIDSIGSDGSPGVFAGGALSGVQPEDGAPLELIDDVQSTPGSGNWVFLNGEWVRVAGATPDGLPEVGDGLSTGDELDGLVTQRVISVPVERLLSGDARVNVVIRAGDVVRVPPGPAGNIYMGGFVNGPGAYGITRNLTLLRAIDAAGGLGALAIPERVDLTRMVGPDRQATIRLNLRAIAEQTQPDIFMKPNDRVNVGTNFWAFPLAVVRGGFRATYGFGFLLDRNFGNDVFGAPPTNFN